MAKFGILTMSENSSEIKLNFLPIGSVKRLNGKYIADFSFAGGTYRRSARTFNLLRVCIEYALGLK